MQALQVILFYFSSRYEQLFTASQPFDLTDMDWSSELWVACHDDDEQNARLAHHLWEDNGLDVSETFLDDLLPFLGLRLTIESVVTFTDVSHI